MTSQFNSRKGPAAFASIRSYYFRMFVENFRQHQREACESQDTPLALLRVWFKQANFIARKNG